MEEAEAKELWRTSTDPLALLRALHPLQTLGSVRPQTRQSRLYLLACARRQWERLPHSCRVLVGLAETVAEMPLKNESLRATAAAVAEELMESDGDERDFRAAADALAAANIPAELKLALRSAGKPTTPTPPLAPDEWCSLARLVYLTFELKTPSYHWVSPKLHSFELLREVYGNPYELVTFDAAWRTSTVLPLAMQIYARGDFGAMPILADALQDAGCNNDDILNHCRHQPTHVRGCWVLDLVLKLR